MGKPTPTVLALLALSMLAGCSRPQPTRPELSARLAGTLGPTGKVNAAGETPLWAAQVRPGLIRVSLEDGRTLSAGIRAFSTTPTTANWSGATRDGIPLQIVVEAKPCRDAATNLTYPLSARAEAAGRTVSGCAAPPGQGLGPRD